MGRRSVPTVNGNSDLSRAMIEHAITASEQSKRNKPDVWLRLVAGLKMDGFELVEEEVPDPMGRSSIFDDAPRVIIQTVLRRMLPEDVPETDFREATSESLRPYLVGTGLASTRGIWIKRLRTFRHGTGLPATR